MADLRRLAATLIAAASLLGCMQKALVPPASGRPPGPPQMPAMEAVEKKPDPAPVFADEYSTGHEDDGVQNGLFAVHGPDRTQIALLKNGDESFTARAQLIQNAKHSIRIQALIFAGDESGLYLTDILKRKKAEGLDVRIIVDSFSNLGLQTQWMYFDLKQHDIEVEGYESLYLQWLNEVPLPFISPSEDPEAPNHRYHEKMWIVDAETDHATAVVGGLNVANEYFRVDPTDPDDFWRDQDVIVKGRIVEDMAVAFDRNFDHFLEIKKSRGVLNTNIYWQQTRAFLQTFGKLRINYAIDEELVKRVKAMANDSLDLDYQGAMSRFFQNRPRLGESYIDQAYANLISSSEKEILICNAYFIPSTHFIDMIRDAVARGVRVVILTNSPETNDLPEMSMVGRSYYKKILELNDQEAVRQSGGSVEIWEWYGWRYDEDHQTEGTIHAKYAVFDRLFSLVGSYNLDPRSEKLNSETAIVFESNRLSVELARLFWENDLAYSRKVTKAKAEEFEDPSDALYKIRKEFGGLFESLL